MTASERRLPAAPAAVDVDRRDLRGLTSLRFVAALLVLVHHAAGATGLPFGLAALGNVGFVGVDFFFVLSGFVLTWSHREGQSATTFWRHRFVRVYPLHVVGWLLAVVLTVLLVQFQDARNIYPLAAWFLALILLQAWVPSPNWAYAANGVSWSLACEALFYAVFPWLHPRIAALPAHRLRRIGVGVFLLMVAAVVVMRTWNPPADTGNPGVLYTNPLYRLGEFVIGIVLARLLMSGWRPRLPAGVALVIAAVYFVVVAGLFSRLGHGLGLDRLTNAAATRELGGLLLVPAIVLVLATTAASDLAGRMPRWLGSELAVRLGRWSFAFYIVHQLVLNTIATTLPVHTAGRQVATLVVAGVISTALAAVLHHGVEVPLVRRWRGSRPPEPVT